MRSLGGGEAEAEAEAEPGVNTADPCQVTAERNIEDQLAGEKAYEADVESNGESGKLAGDHSTPGSGGEEDDQGYGTDEVHTAGEVQEEEAKMLEGGEEEEEAKITTLCDYCDEELMVVWEGEGYETLGCLCEE